MFEFVRTHTRILQFVLVLLIFPSFVFFGIQGYSRMDQGEGAVVAKVGGLDITQAAWDGAQRDQIERMRRQMPNVDVKLFDTPAMKHQTLEKLVREKVLQLAAQKRGFTTTEERLLHAYLTDTQFESFRNPDGRLNKSTLEAALTSSGISVEGFENRMRQELAMQQVMFGVTDTVFAPAVPTAGALDAMYQQREVQVERFNAKDYAGKLNPSPTELEAYYNDPAHAAKFQLPEQVNIEYVMLDIDSIKKGISVTEDELRKYYAENEKRYVVPEERRASHILIKVDKDTSAADRSTAKAKAESLLAELKKNPSTFADLARKNSQDSGSAERGGDLDFFGRGAMVKPFEDAAFGLKPGELSAVVESDFGYHIILLVQVRGGEKRSFDAVRAEVEGEVKRQMAQKRFSDLAVEFTNMVYEQSDTLKPVADKLKLELRTAKDVRRSATREAEGPLASTKFLEALFGNEVLRNKHNTEAIETAPNQLVSGRVVEYKPAAKQPLSEVTVQVREQVIATQAAAMARKEGEARLAVLRKAPDTPITSSAQVVSRAQPGELPKSVLDAILKVTAMSLPGFAGVDLGEEGYAVAKVIKVLGRDPAAADVTRAQSVYAQAWGGAEAHAYYAALKSRFKVDIPAAPSTLEQAATTTIKSEGSIRQ